MIPSFAATHSVNHGRFSSLLQHSGVSGTFRAVVFIQQASKPTFALDGLPKPLAVLQLSCLSTDLAKRWGRTFGLIEFGKESEKWTNKEQGASRV
jgi:hypothetical protein